MLLRTSISRWIVIQFGQEKRVMWSNDFARTVAVKCCVKTASRFDVTLGYGFECEDVCLYGNDVAAPQNGELFCPSSLQLCTSRSDRRIPRVDRDGKLLVMTYLILLVATTFGQFSDHELRTVPDVILNLRDIILSDSALLELEERDKPFEKGGKLLVQNPKFIDSAIKDHDTFCC